MPWGLTPHLMQNYAKKTTASNAARKLSTSKKLKWASQLFYSANQQISPSGSKTFILNSAILSLI